MDPVALRAQISVKGVVQGVGFRPFVYNLAGVLGLKGFVANTGEGVLVDVEGPRIAEFIERLRTDAPPLSRITEVSVIPAPFHGYSDFVINVSLDPDHAALFTLVSPDVSMCDDCLAELLDPSDRRYLYPFINCTNCGPRYSITRSVPYDRLNTTMAVFTMCPSCLKEYHEPGDRRFHAQPNACPECGPSIEYRVQSTEFSVKDREAIERTIDIMKNGGIVAVKGLGGFHIACDATNDEAVRKLREKKRKSNKPFAVMMPDVETIRQFCEVTKDEVALLTSSRRPVVLLRKRTDRELSGAVSPNNSYLGCMLPYTPLHYLLFHFPYEQNPCFSALVMTSGNLSEEPIVRDNEEAFLKLSGLVDAFLVHNRDIFMRVDDSVVRVQSSGFRVRGSGFRVHSSELRVQSERQAPDSNGRHGDYFSAELRTLNSELSFLRRSRGYAPDPIPLSDDGPEVLGCGADLKNTFTLTKGRFAIPSQHIGDRENYETEMFFEECLENLKAVYRVNPIAIAHDLHPGYHSTRWARDQGSENSELRTKPALESLYRGNSELMLFPIQHHYAHIGSVMAEHGIKDNVIGVAFDGTGYGTDGKLWGGEFIIAGIEGFERVGQFKYVPLPGDEAAIREPWKTSVSYVMEAAGDRAGQMLGQAGFLRKYGKAAIDQVQAIARSRDFSTLSSGAGRLFDAVSALIGVCDRNTFEGEAAMALEALTREGIDAEYVVEFKGKDGYTEIDFGPAIHGIIRDLGDKLGQDIIATKFHNTVATAVRTMVRKMNAQFAVQGVALSGGTFQNFYLLNRVVTMLSQDGMRVYINKNVPCNDGGISLGQAYLVRERLKKSSEFRGRSSE